MEPQLLARDHAREISSWYKVVRDESEQEVALSREPSAAMVRIPLPEGSRYLATTTGVGNVVFVQQEGGCHGIFSFGPAGPLRTYVYDYEHGTLGSPEPGRDRS